MDEGSDSRFGKILKKLFGKSDQPDLEEYILEAQDEGELEGEEVSMLLNILDLDEKTAAEIMVPRTDMDCAEDTSTIHEVANLIVTNGAHSRIPIYHDNRDHIVGVLHAKDVLKPLLEDQSAVLAATLMRPPTFIQENTTLDQVFSLFKRQNVHMAIVQDEYGGTSGLITLEDVLEEIVGDIADEYDDQRPEEIHEEPDGSFIASGRLLLDELEEKSGIMLVSEQVDSLGGYLAALSGRIPRPGEFYMVDNHKYTILEADDRQIWSVKIEPVPGTA